MQASRLADAHQGLVHDFIREVAEATIGVSKETN